MYQLKQEDFEIIVERYANSPATRYETFKYTYQAAEVPAEHSNKNRSVFDLSQINETKKLETAKYWHARKPWDLPSGRKRSARGS